MIQILGLRPYRDSVGKVKLSEKFFNRKWRAESIQDLFINIEKHIENIPEEERYNLYYTASHCFEEPGRKLREQFVIPFDIDGIDVSKIDDYIEPCLKAMAADFNTTGIVASGNGLQFIICSNLGIDTVAYFDEVRHHYKAICERIDRVLKDLKLPGSADPQVWSPARLLRLPCTDNRKTPEYGFANKNSMTKATLLQRMIEPVDYLLSEASGVPNIDETDQLVPAELKKYPPPETDYVLEECLFLKECQDRPDEVTEENWYKMLSITSRLDDGINLSHALSEGHKDYSQHDCQTKIEQSLKASGPRTCSNIGQSFNCVLCPHYQKVVSPIVLHSPDYIKTKNNGFRNFKINKSGEPIKGAVNYEDLRKFFEQQHDYISCTDKSVYVWKESNWERMDDSFIDYFVEKHVDPSPLKNDCSEFRAKILRTNVVRPSFFEESTFRKMNLKNGVLDLSGNEPVLLPHSKDYGFMSTLPYEYDPEAKCPRFDKFMTEITLGRLELERILLEFAGYSFANEKCKHAKSLILVGDGSNGKSTFLQVLTELAGDSAYSSVPLTRLQDEKYIATLHGKLFNLTEETPGKAFMDSSVFKNIVSGGPVTARHLYKTPFTMKNRAKIIMACNELPKSEDMTSGMIRRLLIVPFDARFRGSAQNKNIDEELFLESAGILNKIVEGYFRLRSQMDFSDSEVVKEEVEEYRLNNDSVLFFYKEYMEVVDGMPKPWTASSDIYNRYRDYCDDNGIKYNLTSQGFFAKLKRYIPDLPKRRKRKGAKKTTGYEGLQLVGIPNEF